MIETFSVSRDTCIHCGLCIKDCPVYIIKFDEEKIPVYRQGKEKKCIRCQHCLAVCPTGSISFGEKKPENSVKVRSVNSEEILHLIQTRRSIRIYKNEPVSRDTIDKIVQMLPFIPTAKNTDDLYFSIIASKEKMDEIRRVTYQKIGEMKKPRGILLLAKKAFQSGNDIFFRGAPAMVAVATDKNVVAEGCETVDSVIALSYFELYANSLGLGTTWCGYAYMIARLIPEMYALLEIPENYSLGCTMLLGNPGIKYQRAPQPSMYRVRIL